MAAPPDRRFNFVLSFFQSRLKTPDQARAEVGLRVAEVKLK
jgi:hypothetical protein